MGWYATIRQAVVDGMAQVFHEPSSQGRRGLSPRTMLDAMPSLGLIRDNQI